MEIELSVHMHESTQGACRRQFCTLFGATPREARPHWGGGSRSADRDPMQYLLRLHGVA